MLWIVQAAKNEEKHTNKLNNEQKQQTVTSLWLLHKASLTCCNRFRPSRPQGRQLRHRPVHPNPRGEVAVGHANCIIPVTMDFDGFAIPKEFCFRLQCLNDLKRFTGPLHPQCMQPPRHPAPRSCSHDAGWKRIQRWTLNTTPQE